MATTSSHSSSASEHIVLINRAPVLTLWTVAVAERVGRDRDSALSLGKALAVLNAQSKGRRLGIFSPGKSTDRPRRVRDVADEAIELMGRSIPVRHVADGVRAVLGGQIVAPAGVQRALERSFGDALPRVEQEMRRLAAAYSPDRLGATAWSLYERFRPEIPPGQRGWGARGELNLHLVRDLRPARARRGGRQTARAHAGTDEGGGRDNDAETAAWTKETSMGQARNSNRNATLDEKKTRAAGRQARDARMEIRDARMEQFAKGKTAGASGKGGTANRPTGGYTQGAGGGGGAGSRPRAAAVAAKDNVGRSTRPARKRGT